MSLGSSIAVARTAKSQVKMDIAPSETSFKTWNCNSGLRKPMKNDEPMSTTPKMSRK